MRRNTKNAVSASFVAARTQVVTADCYQIEYNIGLVFYINGFYTFIHRTISFLPLINYAERSILNVMCQPIDYHTFHHCDIAIDFCKTVVAIAI